MRYTVFTELKKENEMKATAAFATQTVTLTIETKEEMEFLRALLMRDITIPEMVVKGTINLGDEHMSAGTAMFQTIADALGY